MIALVALFAWFVGAGLTTIPLSRNDEARTFVGDTDAMTVGFMMLALAVAWPAFLTCLALGWIAKRTTRRWLS